MEWFKQWLLGITAAAMLSASAGSLMPKGTVRQIGKLTGGLVLLFAVLHPIYQLDDSVLSEAFSPYIGEIAAYEIIPETGTASLMKSIIEEECSAYIQNKAQEMGMDCRVAVRCAEEGEQYPYPISVAVIGTLNESQVEQLKALIETDLAVPETAQTYQWESGEKD